KNDERLLAYARRIVDYLGSLDHVQASVENAGTPDLRALAGELLEITPEELDGEAPLQELGFDPVTLTDLSQLIEQQYGTKLKIDHIAEAASLNELAQDVTPTEPHGDDALCSRLADICYTLQVGREPMTERLALVVPANPAILIEQLKAFIAEREQIEGLQLGAAKTVEGDAPRVKSALKQADLPALARLWVEGHEIEWQALYPNGTPNRTPIPGYPFAKRRYWVEGEAPKASAVEEQYPLCYFEPVWLPKRLESRSGQALPRILMLAGNTDLARALAESEQVTWIEPGNAFATVGPDHYQAATNSTGDIETLFGSLSSRRMMPEQLLYLPESGTLSTDAVLPQVL
ncbi:MAG: hypothetical protein GY731_04250, partial [Gammaproteobacteria bacterium]|nr:hypothetical protein [Gammaproteobacteria bacterium]